MFTMGVFPHGCKTNFALLDFCIEKNAKALWGHVDSEGIEVWDAHLKQHRRVWIEVAMLCEDSAGLPDVLFCKKQPAHYGACPFCDIRGVSCYQLTSTYYVTFLRLLPRESTERRMFMRQLRYTFIHKLL